MRTSGVFVMVLLRLGLAHCESSRFRWTASASPRICSVRFSETDAQGIVNNSRLPDWFEVAARRLPRRASAAATGG